MHCVYSFHCAFLIVSSNNFDWQIHDHTGSTCFFSTMHFQRYHQNTWIGAWIITLVAFVLYLTVFFNVSSNSLSERINSCTGYIYILLPNVHLQVNPHCLSDKICNHISCIFQPATKHVTLDVWTIKKCKWDL